MSKSMIVIETPKGCSSCPCSLGEYDMCQINGIENEHGFDSINYRPEHCPLQPYHCEIDCKIAADGLTEMIKEWDRGK